MNINVTYTNPYLQETEITVQRGYYLDDEFIVEDCNHAGNHREEVTNHAGLDTEYTEWVFFCDKCGAWLNEHILGNGWSNSTEITRPASEREIKQFIKAGGRYE